MLANPYLTSIIWCLAETMLLVRSLYLNMKCICLSFLLFRCVLSFGLWIVSFLSDAKFCFWDFYHMLYTMCIYKLYIIYYINYIIYKLYIIVGIPMYVIFMPRIAVFKIFFHSLQWIRNCLFDWPYSKNRFELSDLFVCLSFHHI